MNNSQEKLSDQLMNEILIKYLGKKSQKQQFIECPFQESIHQKLNINDSNSNQNINKVNNLSNDLFSQSDDLFFNNQPSKQSVDLFANSNNQINNSDGQKNDLNKQLENLNFDDFNLSNQNNKNINSFQNDNQHNYNKSHAQNPNQDLFQIQSESISTIKDDSLKQNLSNKFQSLANNNNNINNEQFNNNNYENKTFNNKINFDLFNMDIDNNNSKLNENPHLNNSTVNETNQPKISIKEDSTISINPKKLDDEFYSFEENLKNNSNNVPIVTNNLNLNKPSLKETIQSKEPNFDLFAGSYKNEDIIQNENSQNNTQAKPALDKSINNQPQVESDLNTKTKDINEDFNFDLFNENDVSKNNKKIGHNHIDKDKDMRNLDFSSNIIDKTKKHDENIDDSFRRDKINSNVINGNNLSKTKDINFDFNFDVASLSPQNSQYSNRENKEINISIDNSNKEKSNNMNDISDNLFNFDMFNDVNTNKNDQNKVYQNNHITNNNSYSKNNNNSINQHFQSQMQNNFDNNYNIPTQNNNINNQKINSFQTTNNNNINLINKTPQVNLNPNNCNKVYQNQDNPIINDSKKIEFDEKKDQAAFDFTKLNINEIENQQSQSTIGIQNPNNQMMQSGSSNFNGNFNNNSNQNNYGNNQSMNNFNNTNDSNYGISNNQSQFQNKNENVNENKQNKNASNNINASNSNEFDFDFF